MSEEERRILRVLLKSYTKINYKDGIAKVIFDEDFEDIAEEIYKFQNQRVIEELTSWVVDYDGNFHEVIEITDVKLRIEELKQK
jgi:hypothetical protein